MKTDMNAKPTVITGAKKEADFLEMFRRLPLSVREHFSSEKLKEIRKKIYDRAKLTDAEREIARDAEIDVYFGQFPALIFPNVLFTNLGWGQEREEEAAALATSIMGYSMLPAMGFLGPIDQLIDAIGYDHKQFPQEKIKFRVVTYPDAVNEILGACGVAMDAGVKNRITKILESYVQEVRTLSGLQSALTKPQKVGGPGLSENEAQAVITAAEALSNEAIFAPEIPVADHGPEESHGTAEPVSQKVWDKAAIAAAYAGSAEEQAAIAAARTALRADGDKNVLTRFSTEVIAEDREASDSLAVVAGALMLAEAGVLLKTIKEPALRAAFRSFLQDANQDDAIAKLDQEPEDATLFDQYLRFLFKVKTDLSDSDAARFALKAANAMKKAGVKDVAVSVAFHPETGEFIWDLGN